MPLFYKKIKKVALPPGTLIRHDDQALPTTISVIDYDLTQRTEKQNVSIESCIPLKKTATVSWINVCGKDPDIIAKIDELFGVHTLVLEDIVNAGQRPKLEEYDDYLFLVLKMITFDENNEIDAEQVSLVLGKNFLITFQEREGDVFDPIRERIRVAKGRIRHSGPDYLAYAVLDAIVDHYFVVLEKIGEKIDKLEEEIIEKLDDQLPMVVHQLKMQAIFLRKQIWPLREVINSVLRSESKMIKKSTEIFLRDVYDHTNSVNDTLEAFREALSGLHDIYLSLVSNRMNEVMKVLTIFAAIFIPLTFMAGIYGMNFDYIPELHYKYGYFILLGLMAFVGFGMLYLFKKKDWI